MAALLARLQGRGLPCRRLKTSHAFHSAAVEPLLDLFAARVRAAEPKPPQIPFLSNLTGTWITAGEATDPDYWARHLRGTVRFADSVRRLAETPARVYLEVGPGDTLSALIRRNLLKVPGQELVAASLARYGEGTDLDSLARTLGELWLAGVRSGSVPRLTAAVELRPEASVLAWPREPREDGGDDSLVRLLSRQVALLARQIDLLEESSLDLEEGDSHDRTLPG